MTITFEEAQADFLEAQRKFNEAVSVLGKAREIRDGLCKHVNMMPKEYYFPGSYYDTAFTDYWHECADCGHKTERKSTPHSWYG